MEDLCAIPHRGVGTAEARKALEILDRQLKELGADPKQERFRSPRTYYKRH